MVKSGPNTYRVTTRLSSGGGTGTLSIKVAGTDVAGGTNLATIGVPLK
jgi:hypothetical protein